MFIFGPWFVVGFELGEGPLHTQEAAARATATQSVLSMRARRASRAWFVPLVMASSTIVSPLGTQRYAIFCLFRMGAEVFDTDMVIVDQTVTDICFDNVTIL